MIRKLAIVVLALAALLLTAAGAFSALVVSIDNDMFGAGPSSAALVERPAGTVDPKNLNLSGDLLLTFDRSTGLAVRPLSGPSTAPKTLLDAVSVTSLAPGGRYVVAWTGFRWQVVRLADLHVVAERQGAEPFFLDDHRALALFQGNGCSRRDGMILDLREGVARTVKLSGSSGPRPEDRTGDHLLEPQRISVAHGGAAVVVTHRGRDLPEGGHAKAVSWCSLPELQCRVLVAGTQVLGVASADVFRNA